MRWLAYVRRRLYGDPGFYAPKAAVLCPCKGVEPGLERNLVSLTEFERQNYEIFFILASGSDPARSIIERVAKNSRVKAHVVVVGPPSQCSGKVNDWRGGRMEEFRQRRLFADARPRTQQSADCILAGVPDTFLCRDRFRRAYGIHQPPDSHYSCVRGQSLGPGGGHAFSLLPDSGVRH